MVQELTTVPNMFGRLGRGLAQGLSETVPKEIERSRLAAGLKELEGQKDLSRFQKFSRLLAIPGITPQAIQTGGELLRQEELINSFKRNSVGERPERPQRNPEIKKTNFAGISPQQAQQQNQPQIGDQEDLVQPTERGQPQIVGTNPLREETKTIPRWTPEDKIDEIGRLAERFPNLTYPELNAMADENEARLMAQPESARAEDARLKEISDRLRSGFQSVLEKKLQKEGPATYQDISGPMQNNLIRGMERDLRDHPNASEEDVINTWTEKGLDLAKARTQLIGKANSSVFATPILLNRDAYRKSLEDYGDIYKKAGNSEEFVKDLQTYYGFSPMGAASIGYKPRKEISSYISSVPKGNFFSPSKNSDLARKSAIDLEDRLSPNDSLLSIARNLLIKDATFDKNAFFDQLREDKDTIGLNERQRRELAESDQLFSSWADILVLPIFRSE